MAAAQAQLLTPRWSVLRPHADQARLWNDHRRFQVVPAGRRSGKTELAKRRGVQLALNCDRPQGWFVFGAPTYAQAKRIYWRDLNLLLPKWAVRGRSASELTIHLVNGAEITVLGLDAPERIEGRPLDWICCDEYGNMKEGVWRENIRPALSTVGRVGGAWLIGVPEGRNHYYRIAQKAQTDSQADWGYHHWTSSTVLDAAEIEAARSELDELTFQQEYEGSFVNFAGRAYYPFDRSKHCVTGLPYDPRATLVFCFDFNVSPGIAVVCQELETRDWLKGRDDVDHLVTAAIGEVHIPRNSTTPAVCRKLIQDWGQHAGQVVCYGDATGGARGTAKVRGSDWDLIRDELRQAFPNRVTFRVPRQNPRERVRVNAVNSRLRSSDGKIHLLVDPTKAPMLVEDLDGVILLEGGSGELDKKHDSTLTHLTDALGYYIERAHSVGKTRVQTAAV